MQTKGFDFLPKYWLEGNLRREKEVASFEP